MNFEKIKFYFDAGFWTEGMVKKAVKKGIITEAQYQEIVTGETDEATEADYIAALNDLGVSV